MTIQRGSHAFRRQFDLGGIIRLGGERAKGEWNTELSYFRLTDAPRLIEHYGEKPTQLHVLLPDEDPGVVFEDAYELWRGSKKEGVKGTLLCRGDGIVCQRLVDEDRPFDRADMPCPTPPECPLAIEKTSVKQAEATGNPGAACAAVGRLRVICFRVNVMEIYEIRTGSINAFQGLRNQLANLKVHPVFGGRLTGIPFIIERLPKQNRFGGTNYPVRLRVPDWSEMQQQLGYLRNVVRAVQDVVQGAALPPPTPGGHRLAAPGEPGSEPVDLIPPGQLDAPPAAPQERQIEAPPPAPAEDRLGETVAQRMDDKLPAEAPAQTPTPAAPPPPAPEPKKRSLLGGD